MHGSHCEAWRRRCDGVGLLCWWHCWGFIQNWRHTEPAWLPQHPAATCHPIRFAFSWTIIYFSTGQWPQTHLQAVYGLFDQEGEWWSAAPFDLASTITWPKPNQMVWDEMDRIKGQQVLNISGNSIKTVGKPFQVTTSWSSSTDVAKSVQGSNQSKRERERERERERYAIYIYWPYPYPFYFLTITYSCSQMPFLFWSSFFVYSLYRASMGVTKWQNKSETKKRSLYLIVVPY